MSQYDFDTQTVLFTDLAEIARSLGNTHRLALLEHMAKEECCVERLAELSGLSIANTSQHLQHLKRANFVQTRRDGKHVFYGLGTGPIINLLAALEEYAQYNRSEIQKLVTHALHQKNELETISRHELLARMTENSVILLDVRPENEFLQGHLPGAINIPLEELEVRLAELPKNQEIVAYCRGPYCILSVNAAITLRAQGHQVRRLASGFDDWEKTNA